MLNYPFLSSAGSHRSRGKDLISFASEGPPFVFDLQYSYFLRFLMELPMCLIFYAEQIIFVEDNLLYVILCRNSAAMLFHRHDLNLKIKD